MVSQHRLESFFHEIKCNGMTNFMEFMWSVTNNDTYIKFYLQRPPSLFRRLMGVMRNSTTRSSQSLDSEHSDMGELGPEGQFRYSIGEYV